MRDSEPVSGRVAPMEIASPVGAAVCEEGCCCAGASGVDCLHAISESAQRTSIDGRVRMAPLLSHVARKRSIAAAQQGVRSLQRPHNSQVCAPCAPYF